MPKCSYSRDIRQTSYDSSKMVPAFCAAVKIGDITLIVAVTLALYPSTGWII
jgi:hypothetical protein